MNSPASATARSAEIWRDDVDADGHPELLVSLGASIPPMTAPAPFVIGEVGVIDLVTGALQVEVALEMRTEVAGVVSDVEFADVNGDSYVDLLLHQVHFDGVGCRPDDSEGRIGRESCHVVERLRACPYRPYEDRWRCE